MGKFKLKTDYKPSGDQPRAIAQLIDGLARGVERQRARGVGL
ncbi:MAG: hypothetical protein V4760_02935, partial [Bdellovibrionota bacterium]